MNFQRIDSSELEVRRWRSDSRRLNLVSPAGAETRPNFVKYLSACVALLLLVYALSLGGTVLLLSVVGGVLAIVALGAAACIYVQNNTD